ncbi:hypothetical protein CLF_106343 [Clonorchis sinensis]|uniref:Uncharacterized protein n=1 Tax=Clonorchis sinensis TaxID=79923 RepID=G7YEZ8_CLOSI|nr:hypothetical protein CLF_106343 [Clonorchis sinensis]
MFGSNERFSGLKGTPPGGGWGQMQKLIVIAGRYYEKPLTNLVFAEENVCQLMDKTNPSIALGLGEVHPRTLKGTELTLAKHFQLVLRQPLDEGNLPSPWKEGMSRRPTKLHHGKSAQTSFSVLRMIRCNFPRITRMNFQMPYGVYVRPLIEYANRVVYSGRNKGVTLIECVQRAAAKTVAGLKSVDYETHVAVLCHFTSEYRRLRGDLILSCALTVVSHIRKVNHFVLCVYGSFSGDAQPAGRKIRVKSFCDIKVAKRYVANGHDTCRPHSRRQLVHNESINCILLPHYFLEYVEQFMHKTKPFTVHERTHNRTPGTHAIRYQEGVQDKTALDSQCFAYRFLSENTLCLPASSDSSTFRWSWRSPAASVIHP